MAADITDREIEGAVAAVEYAQLCRRTHRRRTAKGDPQREADIEVALKRITTAMKPIRSAISAFPFAPQTEAARARQDTTRRVSNLLQSERRKLWKMRRR